MKRVIVESPFGGPERARNIRYARACLADCLSRGEAPFASHILYTQEGVLDDDVPEDRTKGINAGFAWRDGAHLTAVYTDLGLTDGMKRGIENAAAKGQPVEFRELGGEWAQPDLGELVNEIHRLAALLLDTKFEHNPFKVLFAMQARAAELSAQGKLHG